MYNVMYILKLAMVSKIRKQIYIEAEQNNLLKEKARQTGLSEAEIIRQAINQHIISVKSPTPNLSAWEREKAFRDLRRNNIPARKSLCRRTRPARWYIIKAQVPYRRSRKPPITTG